METEPASDSELMTRLGRGDMAALGDLAQRHQNRVLSLSYRLLGDWHKAEDVTQETFLRLRRAARAYQPTAGFTTWLYRIVHNLSMDQRRGMGHAPAPLETAQVEEASPSEDAVEKAELARVVQEAVAGLPDRQRRVIILHRYEGLSHTEISEVTGWSKSAVESLLVRAYENLRKKLVDYQNSAG